MQELLSVMKLTVMMILNPNSAFIKILTSGGNAMERRKLYKNTIFFIPQFTMTLCYNRFYEVVPANAKKTLEQFEYKSKFVSKEELIYDVTQP